MAIAKPSKAMPFLTAPACQSSGLPGGETGFDPLYISDFMDIKWMREAELKHGRICMLCAACPPHLSPVWPCDRPAGFLPMTQQLRATRPLHDDPT